MKHSGESSFSGSSTHTPQSNSFLGEIQKNESTHKKRKLLALVGNIFIGSFISGYVLTIFNTSFPLVLQIEDPNNPIRITDRMTQRVLSMGGVALSGAITSLFIGSKVFKSGRRSHLMIADLFTIIGSSLVLFYINFTCFISSMQKQLDKMNFLCNPILGCQEIFLQTKFNRLVIGVGVGINSIMIPTYVLEYASGFYGKGRLMVMHQFFFACGITISYVWELLVFQNNNSLGEVLIQNDVNAYLFGVYIIPVGLSLLRMILFMVYFKKDTPYFYILKKNQPKAKEIFLLYYNQQETLALMEIYDIQYGRQIQDSSTFLDMLKLRYRKRMILGVFLNFFCYFSGAFMIILFSQLISDKIQENTWNQLRQIYIGITLLLTELLQIFLTSVIGRKAILLIGQSLFLIGFVGQTITLQFNFGYILDTITIFQCVVCAGFALQSAAIYQILSEILPLRGIAASNFVSLMCITAGAVIYPYLIENSLIKIEIFCICFCFVGWIYIYYFVLETRGKSNFQIEKIYTQYQENIQCAQDQDYSLGIDIEKQIS